MMARIPFILILLLGWQKVSLAGSCCIGTGPRSFVQLKHLQTYDLGLATSFKDLYARFNSYGTKVQSEVNQTATLALGGSFRLSPRSEIYGILPFVNRAKSFGGETRTKADLGDVLLGVKGTLYDPFFAEDWFPATRLLASVKVPTGRRETLDSSGQPSPGTGTGYWEGSLGVDLVKDLESILVGFSTSFTRRFSYTLKNSLGNEDNLREGDRLEFTETVTLPFTQRFSVSIGSTQAVDLDGHVNGSRIADSGGRYTTGLVGASYFVTRLWTVTGAFEAVLPFEKVSVNEEAFRTVTLTSTYAIY